MAPTPTSPSSASTSYPPNCDTLTPKIESCSEFPPAEAAPLIERTDASTDTDAAAPPNLGCGWPIWPGCGYDEPAIEADVAANADVSGGVQPPIWEHCIEEHGIFCDVGTSADANAAHPPAVDGKWCPESGKFVAPWKSCDGHAAVEADVTADAEGDRNLPHGWGFDHIPIPQHPKPHHKVPFGAGNDGGKPSIAADVAEPDSTPTLVEREDSAAAAEASLVPVHCNPDTAQHCVPHPPAVVAERADQSTDNDNDSEKSKRDIIVSGQNLQCITFRSPPSRALAELCSPVGTGLEVTALSRMICGLMIDHNSAREPTLAGRCVPTLQDLSPQAQEKGLACSGVRDPVSNVVFDLCVKAGEKLKVNDEGSVCGWNWNPVNGDLFQKCVNVREPVVQKRDEEGRFPKWYDPSVCWIAGDGSPSHTHKGRPQCHWDKVDTHGRGNGTIAKRDDHGRQEDSMSFTNRWGCANVANERTALGLIFLALLAFGGVLVYLARKKGKKAVRGPSQECGKMDCLPR